MVDIYDDLMQNFKQDFFKAVETMVTIRDQGPAFNTRFGAIGDKGKCRIIEPPIRNGEMFGNPAYAVQVIDLTDGEPIGTDAIPMRFSGTKFMMQQLLREALYLKIYRNLDDISKDRKLRKLKGAVLSVEAIPSTYRGIDARKDYMLDIKIEEYTPDVATTDEILAEVSANAGKEQTPASIGITEI